MLKNGGFEQDWGSHNVLVCRPEQAPTTETRDNIFTPESWVTWFYHDPGTWDQPEVRDARKSGDPRRVHGGEKAILLFTFYRKHDAGFLQQVQVGEGAKLRLEAYAHAWSNWHDGEHPDDPRWSDGPGFDAGFALEGTEGLDDNWRNFTFYLGIDPTGGVSPYADTVVWGQGAHIYNSHALVPPVTVTAQSATVSIFLRSKTLWTFKHNDAYWDDVTLVVTDESGRGQPRVQYDRTYVLLPPSADADLAQAVIGATWDQYRFTAGGSADDAGIGDLDVRRIIAINPGEWPGDLREFYEEFYPGIEYIPLESDSLYQLRGRLLATTLWLDGVRLGYPTTHEPLYVTDVFGRWRGTYYHNGLDLRSSWRVWRDEVLAAEAGEVIVAGYNSAEPWFGYQVRTKHTLADGREMLLRYAHLTADGVYVGVGDRVVRGQSLGRPDNTGTSSGDHLHFDVKVGDQYADPQILIEWEDPSPPIPPIPMPTIILSFQQQKAADYRDEFISRVQPPAWLLIGGFEEAHHLKSLAPNMEIAIRHVDNDWKSYVMASDKDAAAARWFKHYGQTIFDQADYITWAFDLNEYTATNDYESLRATPFWIEALVKRWEREGWPTRLVGLNVPVGNPQHNYICDEQGIPRQIPLLTPAVRILTDNDCLTAYHSYWGIRKLGGGKYYSTLDQPASVRMHYAFRALLSWDPVFTAAGVYPKYALSEGGPIYINEKGVMVSSGAGWKYSETFDGNVDACVASYMQFQALIQKWNAEHGNRARWLTAFLHGGFTEWRHFDMAGEPSRKLADALTA